LPMRGRQFNEKNFRYGFNGKEKDNEFGWQDYGERMYLQRIGRFSSPDPLIIYKQKYPELSSYQFASNRPIDGIDLDGLEYATFNILVVNGQVMSIYIAKDYELKNPQSKGPGVQYYYVYLSTYAAGGGRTVTRTKFIKNYHGIYQGPHNPKTPTIGGRPSELKDNYELAPTDVTDKTAKQHDIGYDNAAPGGLKGFFGILDKRSTLANLEYMVSAEKIIEKYKNGQTDEVTGKPITEEASSEADQGKTWFGRAEYFKQIPIVAALQQILTPAAKQNVNESKSKQEKKD